MNLCLRFTAWLIGVIIQFTISRVSSLLGMMLYWICALLSIKTTLHFSFCYDMSKVAKTVVSTFVQKLMCAIFYFATQSSTPALYIWRLEKDVKGWRRLAGKTSDELTRLCKLVRLKTICAFGKCYELLEQCLFTLLSLNKLIVNCFMQRQTRCSWMMEWGGCQLFFPTNGLAEAVVVKTNAKTPWIFSSPDC